MNKLIAILRGFLLWLQRLKHTNTMGEFIATSEALEMMERFKTNYPDLKEGVEYSSDFVSEFLSGDKVQILFGQYEDGTLTALLKSVDGQVLSARSGDDDDDDDGGEYGNRGSAIPPIKG